MERLQKVIAQSGVTSRRKAEELIKEGKVKVNGVVVTELGTKVSSKDEIAVNDRIIEKETKEYYLLNKPRGVVTTTSDDKNRKTVLDYINTEARIYPVGRLDYDTTGALLLTNDGEFANILMHPNNQVDKVCKVIASCIIGYIFYIFKIIYVYVIISECFRISVNYFTCTRNACSNGGAAVHINKAIIVNVAVYSY